MKTGIRRVSLIYNPNAGSLNGDDTSIRLLESALRAQGIVVDTHATAAADDATRLAREATAGNYDALVVCGGDGTINETLQELAGTPLPLAVFPCGTANVFARDLHLTPDPQKIADMIAAGRVTTFSLGRASKPDGSWHRLFILMAGIGLDAAMVKNVRPGLKRQIGIGAYFASAMDYLFRWPLVPFSLSINGHEYPATFAAVSNSPSFGGGFIMAPGARMDDDQLNVCMFNSRSRLHYLAYAALALGGKHTGCKNVTYLATQSAQAQTYIAASAPADAWVQLDGELVGALPMQFEIVPHALRVITL
ncbi:MAG: diacylglycerol/lipid kinase family protein [Blastocatellia bacterium]